MVGMNQSRTILRALSAAGVVLAVSGTIYITSRLANNQIDTAVRADPVCGRGRHANHKVTIQNDVATPGNTVAPVCDTLTITNFDDRERLMAFGLHEAHEPYDGIEERLLGKGESFTITLLRAGTFRFHDHDDDKVGATFTVAP